MYNVGFLYSIRMCYMIDNIDVYFVNRLYHVGSNFDAGLLYNNTMFYLLDNIDVYH
jgi:hypothetical protein